MKGTSVKMKSEIFRMDNISKSFSGNRVLNRVNINVFKGEVLALVGENGAGKTTLSKIISGIYRNDEGYIYFDEKEIQINNPIGQQRLGISSVPQKLTLIPEMSIAENIFIVRKIKSDKILLKKTLINKETEKLLMMVGLEINPNILVQKLSRSQKQLVQIAKAISFNAKLIIMDEPANGLFDKDVLRLGMIIKNLKAKGTSVIFISNKLDEVIDIADRIVVLRDGKTAGIVLPEDCTKDRLITMMSGRELKSLFNRKRKKVGEEALRVEGVSDKNLLKDISFTLRKGEILGIAGLVGSGRTELMKVLFGINKRTSGKIFIKGKEVGINNSWDAMKHKIGFVPEDRMQNGLISDMSISENITIGILKNISKKVCVNRKMQSIVADNYIKKLNIKISDDGVKIVNLSGGNQQKVVLSKWMATNPEILLLDEPTIGLDMATKKELYVTMEDLTNKGVSIIWVSSEFRELITMSDRILIMKKGRIKIEMPVNEQTTQKKILSITIDDSANLN